MYVTGVKSAYRDRDPPGQRPRDIDPLDPLPSTESPSSWTETPSPGQRPPPPWTETPLDRYPQWTETPLPWTETSAREQNHR